MSDLDSEGRKENMTYLVVDDERMSLELLKAELGSVVEGETIVGFQDPEEAYSYAKEHPCDVAFLDIEMTHINGIMLAKMLKELNPKINIIFVTAYNNYGMEAFSLHASGYVLKPVTAEAIKKELSEIRYPQETPKDEKRIRAVTFGQFDLLLDGQPVHFGRAKSKELLAYLIHKKGGGLTRKELAAAIFEDAEYSRNVQDYVSKIVRELESSLKKAGIEDLLVHDHNRYAVNTDLFSCDAYEFDNNDPAAVSAYRGEYMVQYSWAEGAWYDRWFDDDDD